MTKQGQPRLNNLQLRIITGVLGIVAIVAALYYSVWGYFILFGGLMVACQWEFYGLLKSNGWKPLRWYGIILSAVAFVLPILAEALFIPPKLAWFLLPALTGTFIIKLYHRQDDKPIINIGLTFLGILYAALPFVLFNYCFLGSFTAYSYQVVLGILILLWCSDSGAYFAGKSLGRTKLFERISPKKTWEGTIGGAVAAGIACAIMATFWHDLNWIQWAGLAVIIVVIGTYGDLVESMFKRSLSLKDSGSALPGHGGFLDRFDGLLVSLPFIAAWLALTS